MTSVTQVLVVCIAAVLLILILVCLKALWDVVVLKFYPPLAKNNLPQQNGSSTTTTSRGVSTTSGNSSRTQQMPSISFVVTQHGTGQNHQTATVRNSHLERRNQRNEQSGTHVNRREGLPGRTYVPCQCSIHRNHLRTTNTTNAANELQILKIHHDSPPSYHDATKLPTFAESQQYNWRENGTISE